MKIPKWDMSLTRREAQLSTMRAVLLHFKSRSTRFDHNRGQYCELQHTDQFGKPKLMIIMHYPLFTNLRLSSNQVSTPAYTSSAIVDCCETEQLLTPFR
jgi:hypothetical protein